MCILSVNILSLPVLSVTHSNCFAVVFQSIQSMPLDKYGRFLGLDCYFVCFGFCLGFGAYFFGSVDICAIF